MRKVELSYEQYCHNVKKSEIANQKQLGMKDLKML